jgi:phosphatidylglycerophosphatase A
MYPISLLIASFLGVGHISKKFPGTLGSIAAMILCLLLWKLSINCFSFAVFSIIFLIGVGACYDHIRSENGESSLDPGYIVIDEVVAVFLGVVAVMHANRFSIYDLIIVFLLFRVFDIWKPFPIRQIENFCKNGSNPALAAFGIMIDDIIAVFLSIVVWLACFRVFLIL